jgi:hypothetical protein
VEWIYLGTGTISASCGGSYKLLGTIKYEDFLGARLTAVGLLEGLWYLD